MNPEIRRIASRVVWWEPPEVVVTREEDFICRAMALGQASPGIFDARSWHYWHHRLGLGSAGPLPTRACVRVD